MSWKETDKGKFWVSMILAVWPSLAASSIFTAVHLDARATWLAVGNALYQGAVNYRSFYSNPKKPS